jgi:hypothetical protein
MGFDRYTSYTEHGQRKPGQKNEIYLFSRVQRLGPTTPMDVGHRF